MALDKQDLIRLKVQLENIGEMTNEELSDIYDCNIKFCEECLDSPEFSLLQEKKDDG